MLVVFFRLCIDLTMQNYQKYQEKQISFEKKSFYLFFFMMFVARSIVFSPSEQWFFLLIPPGGLVFDG